MERKERNLSCGKPLVSYDVPKRQRGIIDSLMKGWDSGCDLLVIYKSASKAIRFREARIQP